MKTIYDVSYFIKKFEAIPDELIIPHERHDGDKHCAHGWCDLNRMTAISNEELALKGIAKHFSIDGYMLQGMAPINNGDHPDYQQPTPKQRILAALYDIKAKQQPEIKERIVYVTVDEKVRELQKAEILN